MLCLPEALSLAQVASLFGILAGVLMVGLYLWSRKATKHPEYAASLEAKLDAVLRSKGLNKLADLNLVAGGQEYYAGLRAAKAAAEAEAKELQEAAAAKLAQAVELAKKIGE